jgi:hypothetical protein
MANIEYFKKKIMERGYTLKCIYQNPKYKQNIIATKGDETITGSISAIYRKIFGYC